MSFKNFSRRSPEVLENLRQVKRIRKLAFLKPEGNVADGGEEERKRPRGMRREQLRGTVEKMVCFFIIIIMEKFQTHIKVETMVIMNLQGPIAQLQQLPTHDQPHLVYTPANPLPLLWVILKQIQLITILVILKHQNFQEGF